MATRQSLLGICFVGIQRLASGTVETSETLETCWNLPESLYFNWMGMAAKIQQRNETLNRQCVELQDILSKMGFRSCILKGQGNAENYSSCYEQISQGASEASLVHVATLAQLRQSGDIDIWLEGGYEKVMTWVQKVAPTRDVNQHHAHFDCFSDTEVEIHYYPFLLNNPFRNKVLRLFFSQNEVVQFANQVRLPDDSTIIAADNNFNLVFQFVHIFHHVFTEGIGLRQLMDYYFVLRAANKEGLNYSEKFRDAKKVIHELGLNRFASALMWILNYVFEGKDCIEAAEGAGLSKSVGTASWMPWKPNEEDGKFLLNEIMLSGNFGHYDERVPKHMSYWKSFWYLFYHNMRLNRFDYWSFFWTPIMRIEGFAWRKINGYK